MRSKYECGIYLDCGGSGSNSSSSIKGSRINVRRVLVGKRMNK